MHRFAWEDNCLSAVRPQVLCAATIFISCCHQRVRRWSQIAFCSSVLMVPLALDLSRELAASSLMKLTRFVPFYLPVRMNALAARRLTCALYKCVNCDSARPRRRTGR